MVGLPQVITQAVAIAVVPAVAGAFKTGQKREVNESVNLGIRTSMIIGMPCALGIMALAEPILLLLFPKEPAGVASAAPTLMHYVHKRCSYVCASDYYRHIAGYQ